MSNKQMTPEDFLAARARELKRSIEEVQILDERMDAFQDYARSVMIYGEVNTTFEDNTLIVQHDLETDDEDVDLGIHMDAIADMALALNRSVSDNYDENPEVELMIRAELKELEYINPDETHITTLEGGWSSYASGNDLVMENTQYRYTFSSFDITD